MNLQTCVTFYTTYPGLLSSERKSSDLYQMKIPSVIEYYLVKIGYNIDSLKYSGEIPDRVMFWLL